MDAKEDIAIRLGRAHADAGRLRASAAADPDLARRRHALRVWQADRLARTHADLLADPKTAPAARFFLTDIYGPEGHPSWEGAVAGIVPLMRRLLPPAGLAAVADAVELDALSEALDADMIAALGGKAEHLTPETYTDAYRRVGQRERRERQVAVIGDLGAQLGRLVGRRMISTALSMMRKPARLAGLGDLQDFLERGFDAFRRMDDPDGFVERIVSRERAVMEGLFRGNDVLPP